MHTHTHTHTHHQYKYSMNGREKVSLTSGSFLEAHFDHSPWVQTSTSSSIVIIPEVAGRHLEDSPSHLRALGSSQGRWFASWEQCTPSSTCPHYEPLWTNGWQISCLGTPGVRTQRALWVPALGCTCGSPCQTLLAQILQRTQDGKASLDLCRHQRELLDYYSGPRGLLCHVTNAAWCHFCCHLSGLCRRLIHSGDTPSWGLDSLPMILRVLWEVWACLWSAETPRPSFN